MSTARTQCRDPRRIAYVVSRFPKLSETFILREMGALERLGWRIDLFPFIRLREPVCQPGVERWLDNGPGVPIEVALATAAWLIDSPWRLLSLYALVIRALWHHPGELARGFVALARAGLWARQARARGISHVHAHFALHPVVAALALARLTGITFSFTGHSHDIYRHPAMLAEKVRRARFVVVVSRLLRDRYLAPLVQPSELAKVHVVRCGIDTATYAPAHRAARSTPPTIVAVTRLIEVKGLCYLVEACSLLAQRGVHVRCHIIGEGPLRDALEQQIVSLGLSGCVALLGARPQAEVKAALEEASIFLLPSIVTGDGTMEGVPVSLMEAMALGVPVVATRTGAVHELVEDGETGLLVDPGDAVALAAAIGRLLDDGTLVQGLAAGARRRLVSEFDLQSNVALLHRLFLQATGDMIDETPRVPEYGVHHAELAV